MSTYIQVLSCDTADSSACIVVFTENCRFIFDIGEGTQRLCVEHKVKLGKVEGVFLSTCSPSAIAGLPGFTLTAYDAGRTNLTVFGPPGLNQYWENVDRFVRRPELKMMLHESNQSLLSSIFTTNDLTIEPIGLCSSSQITSNVYICKTPTLPGKFNVLKAQELNIPKGPMYGTLKSGKSISLPNGDTIHPDQVLGEPDYGRFFMIVGNLDADELYSLIESKAFLRFQGSDRQEHMTCIIHMSSIDVLEDPSFILWMKSFGASTHHLFTNHNKHDLSSTSFLASTFYTQKLHMISSSQFSDIQLLSSDNTSNELDTIDSNVILASPLMKYHLKYARYESNMQATVDFITTELDLFRKNIETSLPHIFPNLCHINDLLGLDKPSIEKLLKNDSHVDDISSLKLDPRAKMLLAHDASSIWFLGTACAIPSKYRNVSGILIEIRHTNSFILLEVGEGTWNQLVRMCSCRMKGVAVEDLKADIAQRLKLIWISHPHADHHLGLITVITERWKYLMQISDASSPLIVIAPTFILSYLKTCCEHNPLITNMYIGISNQYVDPYDKLYITNHDQNDIIEPIKPKNKMSGDEFMSFHAYTLPPAVYRVDPSSLLSSIHDDVTSEDLINYSKMKCALETIGIESIINTKVIHCPQAYGVSITLKPSKDDIETASKPFKIVYSGDTRPCLELIHLGHDATILIHEATFEDSLEIDALSKRHSTISEAISVGKAMNAYRVILTHFSQRYQSIPALPTTPDRDNLILAFDYMHVSFKHLLFAPLLTNPLLEIFPPDKDEDEDLDEVETCHDKHPSGPDNTRSNKKSRVK